MLPDRSIVEAAIERGGIVKAHRVTVIIGLWLFAERRLGRPLANVEDFAAFWNLSDPQGYRKQQQFRELFPEYRTPRHLVDSLAAAPVIPVDADEDAAIVAVALTPMVLAR